MNLIDVVTPENWHLHTMEDYVREVNEERENLHSEIAGLRAKHNDYEHPQDSIDRGNRISQLEIDKHNLQTQLAALRSELSTCTECKQPVDCALKATLRERDREIERLQSQCQHLGDLLAAEDNGDECDDAEFEFGDGFSAEDQA